MSALLTLVGLVAAPALGVKLTRSAVDEQKDTANTVAAKVAGVYGGLAFAGYVLSEFTDSKAVQAFGKGVMYGSGSVGGLALGERLFFSDVNEKIQGTKVKQFAGIQGQPRHVAAPAWAPVPRRAY